MKAEWEYKGIEIIFYYPDKYFYTFDSSPVGGLQADSYKDIVKQIDAKLEEKELKSADGTIPTREYINDLVIKYAGGSKTVSDTEDFPKEYRGYEIYYDAEGKQLYFESQRNKSGLGHLYVYAPSYDILEDYINSEIYKIEEDKESKNNSFFRHCKNYNKLSPEDKTLIENLIKSLNEKN